MLYAPWSTDPSWQETDPKLKEASAQPLQLNHTLDMARTIPLHPAGILFLRGPRQVGKSTLLSQMAVRCLSEGIEPGNLVRCDAERARDRHHLLGELESFLESRKAYAVLLIDELTSVDGWWLAIKALADRGLTGNALILGTGSSAPDMQKGADLMPGRRGRRHPVDFELLPVPYSMVAKRLGFDEYLMTGGFPWAINEYIRLGFIPSHVYEVHMAAILGAFQKSKHQTQNLSFLLQYLARHQGSPGSVTKLSRDCGLGSNNTGEEYLSLLERIFAVHSCPWTAPAGGPKAPRKNRKFYAADPFLFHLFCEAGGSWDPAFSLSKERLQDPELTGRIVEGVVAAELRRRGGPSALSYWSGDKEIDFTGRPSVEVKYQNHVSIGEFTWAEKVLPKAQELLVLTKKDRAVAGRVRLMPLEDWLLNAEHSPHQPFNLKVPLTDSLLGKAKREGRE